MRRVDSLTSVPGTPTHVQNDYPPVRMARSLPPSRIIEAAIPILGGGPTSDPEFGTALREKGFTITRDRPVNGGKRTVTVLYEGEDSDGSPVHVKLPRREQDSPSIRDEAVFLRGVSGVPHSVRLRAEFELPNAVPHEFIWEPGDEALDSPQPTPFSSAPALVTDRPKGRTLTQWVRASGNARPLKASEVISIGRQGLEFLGGLKQEGLIHGGLSLGKINYDETTNEATFNSSSLQKLSYRAPEIVLDRGYSSAVDMWTLGCILFELYTGEELFEIKQTSDPIADDCRHLWQISERLVENPSGEFLLLVFSSPRFSELYRRDNSRYYPLREVVAHPIASLGDAIRSARERRGDPEGAAESMLGLIEPMLRCEEERISPEAALQNPLFQSELASLS